MQQSFAFDNAQPVDFLLIIEPSFEVQRFVKGVKNEIFKEFGDYAAKNSKPHITLLKYVTTTDIESKIIGDIKLEIAKTRSFTLRVTGFGSFQGSNTLHLETDFPENLRAIQQILSAKKQQHRISNKSFALISKPHITIAKRLIKPLYEELRSRYSKKIYEGSFHVDAVTILRALHTDSKYSLHSKVLLK